ncbi:DUF3135 domain-containing protein [Marinobacter changyiensis]|uniref:DUF3135 domain-containing protein n=1 Tax=Marinobacter changyiensis TaxID=2604091 RepID=UPI0012658654
MDIPAFNELRDLARRDPKGFEILRAELIEDCIRRSSGCNQHRLRGLEFVIEARRRGAGSPDTAQNPMSLSRVSKLTGGTHISLTRLIVTTIVLRYRSGTHAMHHQRGGH